LYKDGALSKSGEWLVADHSEVTEHQVFDALAAALPEEEAQLLHGFTSMTSESSLNKTSTYIPIKSHSPNAINMEASTCNVHFRFEAFVLAVETRTLECASTFLTVAHQCGYRESGISAVAKRFIVNVRGSLRLDVPVVLDSRLLVSPQYIQLLVALANEKMRKNLDKISRFDTLLQATLAAPMTAQTHCLP
jgi:tRNA(Phe) wybutosine-synthesizing methylase Tyw3